MPFAGPIGAARVGYKNGQYLLNPSNKELADSELHLVVAGTEHTVGARLRDRDDARRLTRRAARHRQRIVVRPDDQV